MSGHARTPHLRGASAPRVALAAIAALSLALTIVPASASGAAGDTGVIRPMGPGDAPTLALDVSIASDGTPDGAGGIWDPAMPGHADDGAGNDSGPNNGIVRVNDTVTYRVFYSVNTEVGTNTTFTIEFPKGMEITELPGFCTESGTPRPGSGISPATAGEPTLPLTANSIDELQAQTLTCNVGTKENASDIVFVTAKVLNLVHNGEQLAPTVAQIVADESLAPVEAPVLPAVTASSRLMWDVSKNSTGLAENLGQTWGPNQLSCPWDVTLVCMLTRYGLTLSAPAGGKGAMPAIGDVTVVDDLSPAAMYPTLDAAQLAAIEADLDTYGSRATFIAPTSVYTLPLARIGTNINGQPSTAVNSVRDAGTTTLAQAGPGTPATFTISAADFTLRTAPSQAWDGGALPASTAYAYAGAIEVWTPIATIRDFGVQVQTSWTLATHNELTELDINGFTDADHQGIDDQPGPDATRLGLDGQPMTGVHWNDYRDTSPVLLPPGTFIKRFAGLPGAPGNLPANEFIPGYQVLQGPPGGAGYASGGIIVAPTQTVVSVLQIGGSTPATPGDVSVVACDAWDPTLLNLHAGNYPGLPAAVARAQMLGSGGSAVWISGSNNSATGATPDRAAWASPASTDVPVLTVQYSGAVPGGTGAASACGEAQGPWYDDPALVPGNDPTLAAQGIYTAVSRVRVHAVIPPPVRSGLADGATFPFIFVSIALRAADNGDETGTILPNWASYKFAHFQNLDLAGVLAAEGGFAESAYDPATHQGNNRGDRLILALGQVRIDKRVRAGSSNPFGKTPPNVTGNDLVQYQLTPSLTSGAQTPGILKDVWVEDCLPDSQTYASASLTPVVVSLGSTPDDAKRPACEAGETYLRWILPDQEVNQPIAPIVMSVEVSPTATDGAYTNTVVVWAEDDASTLAQRSDQAGIQIANIAGVKLEKISLTPVVQLNREEQTIDEQIRWRVRLTNTLPDGQFDISNPDVIDVLPVQGEGTTDYNGTLEFVSAEVVAGSVPATRILYTSAPAVDHDPSHASNGPTGTTTWCDAPADGTVVSGAGSCPTSASAVTGLRIQAPGPYRSGEVLQIELTMVGVGNSAGDVYENTAYARAEGLLFPVGPIRREVAVIGSAVGDTVWWDLNQDGEQNEALGAAEPPAPNVPVRITGTDDLGNTVDLSTQTDDDGLYLFPKLRASGPGGYTVTFTRPGGSEFTVRDQVGVPDDLDSDADAAGLAPVVLGPGVTDLTIDAGLIANGGLVVSKLLQGAGVVPFAGGDELVFEVVCTFDGRTVLDEEVLLTPEPGATSVLSDQLGPLPAGTSCDVTETSAGSADEPAPVRTVAIPAYDEPAAQGRVVTASLTNYYSAGTITLTKKLEGSAASSKAVLEKVFEVFVTCQVEEGDGLATVYSGVVPIRGGQQVLLSTAGGTVYLPLGTRCFAEETETGGAVEVAVDAHSWETAVEVVEGTPEHLQGLTIEVVNTFECTPELCPPIAVTGATAPGAMALAAALLALFGGVLLLATRRRARE